MWKAVEIWTRKAGEHFKWVILIRPERQRAMRTVETQLQRVQREGISAIGLEAILVMLGQRI